MLENLLQASPAKRFLNVHAQMAHSPAVLAAYVALRASPSTAASTRRPVQHCLSQLR